MLLFLYLHSRKRSLQRRVSVLDVVAMLLVLFTLWLSMLRQLAAANGSSYDSKSE